MSAHTCQTGLAHCLCRGALILESVLPPRTDEERAMQRCLMDLLIMSDVIDANGDLVEKYSVRTNHDGGDEDPGRDVFVFELGPDGKALPDVASNCR